MKKLPIVLLSTFLGLAACHDGNPNATPINPSVPGGAFVPPPNISTSGLPTNLPSGFPGLDLSAFDMTTTYQSCTDQGPNPQYHEVDVQMHSWVDNNYTPMVSYALKITDTKNNTRALNIVGNISTNTDAFGLSLMAADFQSGSDKIHWVQYVDSLTLTENGKTVEMVCPNNSSNMSSWVSSEVQELTQSSWCTGQGANTLKYVLTSDSSNQEFDPNQPSGGTITATTYQGNTQQGPLGTQLSQNQGTWQLFQGQLAMKFNDGTSKTVPNFWAVWVNVGTTTVDQMHFDFSDHKEVYTACPSNSSSTTSQPTQ